MIRFRAIKAVACLAILFVIQQKTHAADDTTITFARLSIDCDKNTPGQQVDNIIDVSDLSTMTSNEYAQLVAIVGDGDQALESDEVGYNLSDFGNNGWVNTLANQNTSADPVLIRAHGRLDENGYGTGDLTPQVRFHRDIGFGLRSGPNGSRTERWLDRGDAIDFRITDLNGEPAARLNSASFVIRVHDDAPPASTVTVVLDFDGNTIVDTNGPAQKDGFVTHGLATIGNLRNGDRLTLDFSQRKLYVNGAEVSLNAAFWSAFDNAGCRNITIGAPIEEVVGFAVWNLQLNVNDPPVANAQSVSTEEDTAKAITLTGSDVDGDTLSYVIVTPPAHGTLSGAAPNLTYTPAANYNGSDSFTFKVNDGKADSAPATVAISISAVNDPPAITAAAKSDANPVTLPASTVVRVSATDVDGDNLIYTWSKVSGPGNVTFTPNGTSASSVSTAAFSAAGSYVLRATVADGQGSVVTNDLTLTVNAAANLPGVYVSFSDAALAEPDDIGSFRIYANSTVSVPLTVKYTVSGTAAAGMDYQSLSGTAVIPAKASYVDIPVIPIDDTLVEGMETVTLTIAPDPAYTILSSSSCTMSLLDNEMPIITVAATDNALCETGDDRTATFTLTRSGKTDVAVKVYYEMSGSAVAGSDYTKPSGSVSLTAGQTSALVMITALDDALVEGMEYVSMRIKDNSAYQIGAASASGNASLYDDEKPAVSLQVTDGAGSEPGNDTASFAVVCTPAPKVDITVPYTISGTATNGTDYERLSGSVTVKAGQKNAVITVKPLDDTIKEGTEMVQIMLQSGVGYVLTGIIGDSVKIMDND